MQVLLSPVGAEEASSGKGIWLTAVVGIGVVIVALAGWYLVERKTAEAPNQVKPVAPASIPAPVPPGYQETYKQAQAGDVTAMRTLGAVYTYGLGVPPHREEGLRWYKKAAEAGSSMAAQEAKALEKGLSKPNPTATP